MLQLVKKKNLPLHTSTGSVEYCLADHNGNKELFQIILKAMITI